MKRVAAWIVSAALVLACGWKRLPGVAEVQGCPVPYASSCRIVRCTLTNDTDEDYYAGVTTRFAGEAFETEVLMRAHADTVAEQRVFLDGAGDVAAASCEGFPYM